MVQLCHYQGAFHQGFLFHLEWTWFFTGFWELLGVWYPPRSWLPSATDPTDPESIPAPAVVAPPTSDHEEVEPCWLRCFFSLLSISSINFAFWVLKWSTISMSKARWRSPAGVSSRKGPCTRPTFRDLLIDSRHHTFSPSSHHRCHWAWFRRLPIARRCEESPSTSTNGLNSSTLPWGSPVGLTIDSASPRIQKPLPQTQQQVLVEAGGSFSPNPQILLDLFRVEWIHLKNHHHCPPPQMISQPVLTEIVPWGRRNTTGKPQG